MHTWFRSLRVFCSDSPTGTSDVRQSRRHSDWSLPCRYRNLKTDRFSVAGLTSPSQGGWGECGVACNCLVTALSPLAERLDVMKYSISTGWMKAHHEIEIWWDSTSFAAACAACIRVQRKGPWQFPPLNFQYPPISSSIEPLSQRV